MASFQGRRGVENEVLDEEKHIKSHREQPQKELERVPIDALPVARHGTVHHELQHREEAACVFVFVCGRGVEGLVEVVRRGDI